MLRKYIFVIKAIFASFLFAVSISLLLQPNSLSPGGISGISIIINHLFGLPIGVLNFIINVPLMIISFLKLGRNFFLKTIMYISLTSVFIDYLATFPPITMDPVLASLFGGVTLAISLGHIISSGGSTGGSDIIVKLLKMKYPHIETGKIYFATDALIVIASTIVFNNIEVGLFTCIALFTSSRVLDMVLYGTQKAILIFIVSEKHEEIASRLMFDLDLGATYINGRGTYSDAPKTVIMCAVKKPNYPKAEAIIYETDVNAFIIKTSADEIIGEGFRSPFAPKM